MKFSEKWLREWVDPSMDTEELAHRLTMIGHEVDALEPQGEGLSGVLVGEVLDVQIASSDLPDFSDFVSREVRSWKFTPPTRAGRPVRATARLPIPIHIN